MSQDDRPEPPDSAGERETIEGFLNFLRASVVHKGRGLSDAEGARRLVPSLTSVSGIIRHLADVERSWFREDMDNQPDVYYRWSEADPDGEFRVSETDSLAGIIADYETACSESREVAARYSLDENAVAKNGKHNLRWIMVHMVEETGRHCGHLDILREMLDGQTGE